jgi:hypothetical protein
MPYHQTAIRELENSREHSNPEEESERLNQPYFVVRPG